MCFAKNSNCRLIANVGFCCAGRKRFGPIRLAAHDLHLMPVIGKFLAALQAYNVGSGEGSSGRTPLAPFVCQWEAVILMRATEKHIEDTCHSHHTPGFRYLKTVTFVIGVHEYMV